MSATTYRSWDRDVVGIGALNLDYIVDIARSAPSDDEPESGLTERLAGLFSSWWPEFEWGTELRADEQMIHAALEQINTASVDVELGGSAFNAILALARMELDLELGYVGIAGRMPLLGFSSRHAFAERGIDDSMVRYDESRLSGVCLSMLDKGERTLCTHAGANAGMADYLRAHRDELVPYLAGSRLIHVTSLFDDRASTELLHLLQAVRETNPAVTISLDPGHVWATNVSPEIEGIIAVSDYLLLNNREFLALGSGTRGDTDEEIAARILHCFGERPGVVVVKRSHGIANFRSDGSKVMSSNVEPLASHEIEDSTGAGDVFAAGVLAAFASQRLHIELGSVLGMALARHKLRYVGTLGHSGFAKITRDVLNSFDVDPDRETGVAGIFLSHGRSTQWLALKEFIDTECGLATVAFNSGTWGGKSVTEALNRYLEQCSFAICVLTAEDTHGGPLEWARENVVHEVGLFQGRFGESRVVLLVEEGCGFVPQAPPDQILHYPRGTIETVFWGVRALIRAEFPTLVTTDKPRP
jgi:sugar/nucleoside kinase (ribokinase family)